MFIKKPSATNAKETYPKYQLIPSDTPSEIISDSPRRISKKQPKPEMIDKVKSTEIPLNVFAIIFKPYKIMEIQRLPKLTRQKI